MEIFMALIKYNTCLRPEDGNPLLAVKYENNRLLYFSRTSPNRRLQHKIGLEAEL